MAGMFERVLAQKVVIPKNPQYTGAYGAALLAMEAGTV